MANETQRVNMVSTGQLLGGLSADRVAERLNRQFGISERQAQAMLKKGTVLKKSFEVEDAKKVARLFARLGLRVTAQTARQPENSGAPRGGSAGISIPPPSPFIWQTLFS